MSTNNPKYVPMGGIAILTKDDMSYDSLITKGAATCHIVTFYNPTTETIALAHVDEASRVDSLTEHYLKVSDNGQSPTIVTVEGGNAATAFYGEELIGFIQSLPNAQVGDRYRRENNAMSGAIIEKDGNILRNIAASKEQKQEDFRNQDFIPSSNDVLPLEITMYRAQKYSRQGIQSPLIIVHDSTIPVDESNITIAPTPGRRVIVAPPVSAAVAGTGGTSREAALAAQQTEDRAATDHLREITADPATEQELRSACAPATRRIINLPLVTPAATDTPPSPRTPDTKGIKPSSERTV